ncbi:YbjN domain-containing protein [Deinococcus lacus]|uniref:YbjN domain-containing protein n=1 Tax=Deinococcus lacus TaxID=392561 RepID=A0ABW1YEX8_9DEIO
MERWLALGLLMTGAAQAQYGPQGTKVDAVLAMAERYGDAELLGEPGDWYIEGVMDGLNYQVVLMDCNKGTRYCGNMYFWASWDVEADQETLNAWNADALAGKGYTDDDGLANLEMWASLKGVGREYLGAVFDQWGAAMAGFEEDGLAE